jgi:hypothetical protein
LKKAKPEIVISSFRFDLNDERIVNGHGVPFAAGLRGA